MHKYRNKPIVVDGERFDSRGEYKRWCDLQFLEGAGEISNLRRQVKYDLFVSGKKVCFFKPDFEYIERGETITEDFKSPSTAKEPLFRLKKKMFEAQEGRELRITFRR